MGAMMSKFDIEKRAVARWIIEQCNSSVEEVEHLLDTTYPEGSYERFKDMYDDVLHHLEENNDESI